MLLLLCKLHHPLRLETLFFNHITHQLVFNYTTPKKPTKASHSQPHAKQKIKISLRSAKIESKSYAGKTQNQTRESKGLQTCLLSSSSSMP